MCTSVITETDVPAFEFEKHIPQDLRKVNRMEVAHIILGLLLSNPSLFCTIPGTGVARFECQRILFHLELCEEPLSRGSLFKGPWTV